MNRSRRMISDPWADRPIPPLIRGPTGKMIKEDPRSPSKIVKKLANDLLEMETINLWNRYGLPKNRGVSF